MTNHILISFHCHEIILRPIGNKNTRCLQLLRQSCHFYFVMQIQFFFIKLLLYNNLKLIHMKNIIIFESRTIAINAFLYNIRQCIFYLNSLALNEAQYAQRFVYITAFWKSCLRRIIKDKH